MFLSTVPHVYFSLEGHQSLRCDRSLLSLFSPSHFHLFSYISPLAVSSSRLNVLPLSNSPECSSRTSPSPTRIPLLSLHSGFVFRRLHVSSFTFPFRFRVIVLLQLRRIVISSIVIIFISVMSLC